ncbi:MAG: 4-hydroxy-tetrahydrodipicolinate synthase [Clostridia bacterium]|nr:4-hydroxy-tetrahydrodipicolinate synthase [Clostridia bacterium]
MSIFTGNATAMITPFNEKGVNYAAFEKHIEFQIENGTAALVIAGTTGEPATMSDDEKKALLKFAVKQSAKRVPVIFGTGCNSTQRTIENSKEAQNLGADALLVVTPYYNKTTQEGLVRHFEAVADSVSIPIITYNVPSRTGLNLEAETLAKIAKHENIVAHKEGNNAIFQVMDMIRLCSGDIDIYSGEDNLTFPLLACGGIGAISVVSNICPDKSAQLISSYMSGDIAKARQIHYSLAPLIKQLFVQVNPIPVKSAMNMLGMDAGNVRMPLIDMEGKDKEKLRHILADMQLL